MHAPPLRRSLVGALAAAAVLAGLLVPAGAASAAREVVRDQVGDVWSPDSPGWTDEGSVDNADLRRTAVSHRDRSVFIKAVYTRLVRATADEVRFTTSLRTSRGRRFVVFVMLEQGGGPHTSYFLMRGSGTDVECEIDGRTSFADDRLHVRVPRSCLGNPRWVRYQAVAESYVEETGLYVDHAIGAGPRARRWSARIPRR